jgi:NADH-quinone oxidoreductase subunit E
MEFTAPVRDEFERLVARYPSRSAALLPTLRLIEREYGAVTEEGTRYAADLLGLPPAAVMGVVSFYTHFRRPADGPIVLEVCCTLPCGLRGGAWLLDAVSRRLGIGVGETTPDGRFTLKKAECLAACDRGPVLAVNDRCVGPLTPETLDDVLSHLTEIASR